MGQGQVGTDRSRANDLAPSASTICIAQSHPQFPVLAAHDGDGVLIFLIAGFDGGGDDLDPCWCRWRWR